VTCFWFRRTCHGEKKSQEKGFFLRLGKTRAKQRGGVKRRGKRKSSREGKGGVSFLKIVFSGGGEGNSKRGLLIPWVKRKRGGKRKLWKVLLILQSVPEGGYRLQLKGLGSEKGEKQPMRRTREKR